MRVPPLRVSEMTPRLSEVAAWKISLVAVVAVPGMSEVWLEVMRLGRFS